MVRNMNNIEELYHLLGYLEGLATKDAVLPKEMEKVKIIIQQNSLFEGSIGHFSVKDYEDDSIEQTNHKNWSEEDYEEVGWSLDDMNPAHDPLQNPWIDVSGPGEEAEMAYWNHD